MKYIECRGGFVKFHPPPNSNEESYHHTGKNGYSKFTSHFARGSKTFKHPPPVGKPGIKNQYEYSINDRSSERAGPDAKRACSKNEYSLYNFV